MRYSVIFFNKTVEQQIGDWPAGVRASFTKLMARIHEHGPNLGMPYTRAMGEGLFEIRARGTEGIGRAFFCTAVNRRIVVLHSFIKKSQETPSRELEIARRRLREIRHG